MFEESMRIIKEKRNLMRVTRRFSAPKVVPRVKVERKFESNIMGIDQNLDAVEEL